MLGCLKHSVKYCEPALGLVAWRKHLYLKGHQILRFAYFLFDRRFRRSHFSLKAGIHQHSLAVVDETLKFDLKRPCYHDDGLLMCYAIETIRKTCPRYFCEMGRGMVGSADFVVRFAKLLEVAVVAVVDAEAVGQESAEQLAGSPI